MGNNYTYLNEDCLWLCPKCKQEMTNNKLQFGIYTPNGIGVAVDSDTNTYICPTHNVLCEKINMCMSDYVTIQQVSDNIDFLEAMIDLKEKDIVEYQLKMSQFRNQANQQRVVRESSVPKCPHCHSAQIKSISGLERGASVLTWGLFSKKINKSFKCNNCGYTW